jgi:YD repeat-containing protein
MYDGINRLTAASEGAAWSQTYGYDKFGNRAVLTGVINAYATPTATSQYTNNRWMGNRGSARRRSQIVEEIVRCLN